MREPLETIGAFVDAFVAAWPTGDASGLAEFFTEDARYRNGPLDPVTGRTAILAALEGFMDVGGRVSVDMVHVVAVGELVMTERIDYSTSTVARPPCRSPGSSSWRARGSRPGGTTSTSLSSRPTWTPATDGPATPIAENQPSRLPSGRN